MLNKQLQEGDVVELPINTEKINPFSRNNKIMDIPTTYCKCGQPIDSTAADLFLYRLTNSCGEVIFEICPHNQVVVDKRFEKKKDEFEFLVRREI